MNGKNNVTPVRLRPATERAIGTTAFFRNRPLYETLLEELKAQGKEHYKILFHACSIGAEAYSFIIQYLLGGYGDDFTFDAHATDLEQGFVEYARNGRYPAEILVGMTRDECGFFIHGGDVVSVTPELKQAVRYMDACSFLDFETEQTFDVVFLLNTLIYVPEDKQSTTIDQVAKYNSGLLATSAFHMDTIKDDLSRNQYNPVLDNQIEIHSSWTDRRVAKYSEELADGIFANWRLPEFSEVEDYEYKYCAIFRKEDFGER